MKNEITDKEKMLREAKDKVAKNHNYQLFRQETGGWTRFDKLYDESNDNRRKKLIDEVCFEYHQPDNKAVDLDELRGKISYIIQNNIYRHWMDIANDDLQNLPWALDTIIEYITPYIQSPPKAISDGESDAMRFGKWIHENATPDGNNCWRYFKNAGHIFTTNEIFKQFKTDTK